MSTAQRRRVADIAPDDRARQGQLHGDVQIRPSNWLVKKLGDLYLHETAISHIRRLLGDDFACTHLGETPSHFRGRMDKVENHMNSIAFARAGGGGGLEKLAKELRPRCQELIRLKGERLPK